MKCRDQADPDAIRPFPCSIGEARTKSSSALASARPPPHLGKLARRAAEASAAVAKMRLVVFLTLACAAAAQSLPEVKPVEQGVCGRRCLGHRCGRRPKPPIWGSISGSLVVDQPACLPLPIFLASGRGRPTSLVSTGHGCGKGLLFVGGAPSSARGQLQALEPRGLPCGSRLVAGTKLVLLLVYPP